MSQEEILLTTQKMGAEITSVLKKEDNIPVCLVVMRGAMAFASDLLKSIKTDVFMDYIHVSSYEGASTNGVIHLHFDVQSNVKGKTVLIIEDIVDTGTTLYKLLDYFRGRGAKTVEICSMLNKPSRRKAPVDPKYNGFVIDDLFVIGYGLDYDPRFRNLPFVGVAELR